MEDSFGINFKEDNKVIKEFRGDFEYLSNFYRMSPFKDECGAIWDTVEHYYQAHKTTHPDWKHSIYHAETPAMAKELGSRCPIVKDWNIKKDKVMYEAITMKFRQNLDIAKKLISTHGFLLIEGNTWHDNYWGRCDCPSCHAKTKNFNSKNMLGQILMKVRNDTMRDQDFVLKIVKEG